MFYRIKCAKVGNHQPICGFTPDHDIAKLVRSKAGVDISCANYGILCW